MRERQAAQLAAAFILRAGRPLGVVRLIKLMYLAERASISRHVFPIVFDDVYAMREGMALSRTFDLMKRRAGTPTSGEWARCIAPPSHLGIGVCRGVSERSLDALTPNDIEVVNDVWEAYGAKNRDALVHDIHHHLEEWVECWNDPSRGSAAVRIPYHKLLETVRGMTEGDAEEAASEVTYFQSLAKSAETQVLA